MRDRLKPVVQPALLCAIGALVTGCVAGSRQARLPEPSPLGREFAAADTATGRVADRGSQPEPEKTESIGLREALALALLRSPALEAYSHEARAAEARVLQAGRPPNPGLKVEVEEFDRGGNGFDDAESAIALGQVLELGGKRGSRKRLAAARSELAGWDYESTRLDVFADTTRRFIEALGAQRRLALAASAAELAEKTAMVVRDRVTAGKESPLRARRATTELEMARLTELEARTKVTVSYRRLAAMWGAEAPHFRTVRGELEGSVAAVPSLETLQARLPVCPELARWDAEVALREAALAASRAARVPDLEAEAGFQRYEEDGTDAVAFGLSLPLPLFDLNSGNVTAAEHELAAVRARRRTAETALSAAAAEAHGALTSARMRVLTLRSDVVPATQDALGAAREAYTQGKLDFMDVLDAGRSEAHARRVLVDAWQDYRTAVAAIERLTATPLFPDSDQQEE